VTPCRCLIAVAALLATSSWAAATSPPPRPGVFLPLEAIALPDDVRDGISADVRRVLPQFGVQPLSAQETSTLLQEIEAAGVVCKDKSEECIVRLGALAAVDVVVAGTMAKAASGGVTLELVVVDVAALQARARAAVVVDLASTATRLAGVTQAVIGVLRPEAWRGQLKVTVQQPGATIVVDGVPRGYSPLPQPISLVPGAHEVWIGLEGFRTRHERLDVAYQKKSELKVVLVPGQGDPLPIAVPTLRTSAASASSSASKGDERASKRPVRVAVYEPTVAGVPERVARIVTSYIAAEIRKRERVSVLGGDELRATMQAANGADTLAGCSEERCLADIADALGVDVVVLVQLTAADGEVFFGVRRIDQAQQEVTGAVTERIADGDVDALLPLVGPTVAKLFADLPLRAGERVGVDDGALRVLHPPPLPPWVTVSFLVAGGVGAVVVGSFGSSWVGAQGAYEGRMKAATTGEQIVVYADVLAARAGVENAALATVASSTATALLFTTGGVLAVFTDWQGLADVDEVPE
jgi:hypothetical protein